MLGRMPPNVISPTPSRAAGRLLIAVIALYFGTVVVVTTAHLWGRPSNNFLIFRTAAAGLLAHQDLYAPHPGQHYDLFKYSPTFALLFLPFALIPYGVSLVSWNVLNGVALCRAVLRLLGPDEATIVLALALPAFAVATLSAQSNSLVTALIITGFLAYEAERPWRATLAVVAGASVKIFPLAALTFAVFRPHRWRAALAATTLGSAAILLPLIVIRPSELQLLYASWHRVGEVDALDRGSSVMQFIHTLLGVDWPNWPFQVAGTVLLLLPLLIRRTRWSDPVFRRLVLASLLVYAVLFNHQAERASFVIAATGVGLWFVSPTHPPGRWRTALAILAAFGMHSALSLPVWIAIQYELYAATPAPPNADAATVPSTASTLPESRSA